MNPQILACPAKMTGILFIHELIPEVGPFSTKPGSKRKPTQREDEG
jgi:hypothetical protein